MRLETPTALQDAIQILDNHSGSSRILAGGTDVLVQMRLGMFEPDLVVDVKRIPEMCEIMPENGGFRVGAAVSGAQLGEHDELCKQWPGVVEAMELIGSTQVQGRATLAGNLCNASPAADSVPALVAADIEATIVGPKGTRVCKVEDIPVSPGKTSLQKGEILSSFFFPHRSIRASDAYLRFIPRTEMDIAVASAGVNLELDDSGKISGAKVALGAVAPTVVTVDAGMLLGTSLEDDVLAKLATACEAACNPIDDKRGTVEFRTSVAGTLAKRAAIIAYKRAGGHYE